MKLVLIFEYLDSEESKMDCEVLSRKPSILMFLPGLYEIEQMRQTLTSYLDK